MMRSRTAQIRLPACLAACAMSGWLVVGCGFMGGGSDGGNEPDQEAGGVDDTGEDPLDGSDVATSLDVCLVSDCGAGSRQDDAGQVGDASVDATDASGSSDLDGLAGSETVDAAKAPPDPCVGLPDYATQTGCTLPVWGTNPPRPMNGQNPASAGPPARDDDCKDRKSVV